MIENDRQLAVTKYWLEEFTKSKSIAEADNDASPILKELVIKSYQSMIDEFEIDIKIYEDLKTRPLTLTS
ncbi:hypothetical protein HGH93_21735 [Chitinophaga polysaccharea]|uniref:hypothetical protein n=1 Tax=Chitinophaga polysaccharea TaxID=1293035 RepID=UPI0014553AEA|nr:hypothetical protein [Chitinophaga polysaccharea]NLR60747.1 hypothetical protein [Chitinophaga polysaccharea]